MNHDRWEELKTSWRWRNFRRTLAFYAVAWLIGAVVLTGFQIAGAQQPPIPPHAVGMAHRTADAEARRAQCMADIASGKIPGPHVPPTRAGILHLCMWNPDFPLDK